MNLYMLVFAGLIVAANPAIACEIEDWNYRDFYGHIKIEGATTCKEGRLSIRVYNGNTEDFIAATTTYIRGYTFETYIQDTFAPSRISIKYSIDP